MTPNRTMGSLLFSVFFFALCQSGYSQSTSSPPGYPFVEEIKFTTFERSVYRIDSSVIDSLSYVDRSKISPSNSLEQTHSYFDSQENKVTDKEFLDSDNKYGEWYSPPDILRYSKDGIFVNRSESWDTLLASQDYYDHYEYNDSIVTEKGLLNGLVFWYPDSNIIDSLESAGIQVTVQESLITLEDSDFTQIFDLNDKSVSTFFIDNNGYETTIFRDYQFNDTAGTEILSQFTEFTRGFMLHSVNNCVEHINQVDYVYNRIKPATQFSLRSQERDRNSEWKTNIFPNPITGHLLNIQLSEIQQEAQITLNILDMTGRKLYSVKEKFSSNTIQFRIPKSIPDGVYLIHLQMDDQISTTKVIFNNK